MNNPSPLVPQGSLPEQKNVTRARVRLAVFCVLTVHVIGLTALLMQGCRKPADETTILETNAPVSPFEPMAPALDTNLPATNVAEPALVEPAPIMPAVPALPATQEYTVVKGDSFYSIAKKFGVSMQAVQDANPSVQPLQLQPGQKLQIPAPPPAAPSAAPGTTASTGEFYTVKSGDTLTRIATELGTTVKALRSENNLTTDRIRVGQKLKIPARTTAPAGTAPAPGTTTP